MKNFNFSDVSLGGEIFVSFTEKVTRNCKNRKYFLFLQFFSFIKPAERGNQPQKLLKIQTSPNGIRASQLERS